MDPNETLRQARLTAAELLQKTGSSQYDPYEILALAEVLAERFEALDEWISHGGFLPSAWRP